MDNEDIILPRNVLSLDIDYGRYYLNVYGTFSDQSEVDVQAAVGSG